MKAMACFQKIATVLVLAASFFFCQASQGIRVQGLGHAVAAAPSRTAPGQCSVEAVAVYQSPAAEPLPSGIPRYLVDIMNVCEGCTVGGVHIACGEFASTELVDPAKFRRLADNDCLVKAGGELAPSEVVSFEYTNSFPYSLRVASVSCQ